MNKMKQKINCCYGCIMFIHVACLRVCVLFCFHVVCLHVCAYALNFKVHCRSALGAGASGLPYHVTASGKNKRTIDWQKVNSLINQLID